MRAPTLTGYRDRTNRFGHLPDPGHLAMAAHEAAHAVVAAALGYRVDRVLLERRANGHLSWDGRCEYRDAPGWEGGTALINHAIVTVAAYAGQRHLEGSVRFRMPDGLLGGDAEDLQAIAERLEAGYSARDLRERVLPIARGHLARHDRTWQAVTYALMRHEELDGDDLAAIDADLFAAVDAEPAPAARGDHHGQRLQEMSTAQRHRVADALERLLTSYARDRSGAPTYRVGSREIETRVHRPGLNTRGAA